MDANAEHVPWHFVSLRAIDIDNGFWAPRQARNRAVTLPVELENLRATGHVDALRLAWTAGEPNPPHIFWESDLAKWMEAVAYSLAKVPDPELEQTLEEIIDLLAAAQQPDGYLNSHFTVVEPDKRWANLRDWHELYCAGHLIEAAVAHFETTGRRDFLNIVTRYADYIATVFGPESGQRRGYPGHQEIELALVKLYRATGDERYLSLSRYFIDERGAQPHYYDQEAQARGEDPAAFWAKSYEYNQSHAPVREQSDAVGHAVRAMYMYSAMAELAQLTGDQALWQACRRLFVSVSRKRMYITGGVGSSRLNEGFTADYDLPNESAYAETCASIALIFWMQRMLQFDCDSQYADVMERALYNGFLSGVSLTGDTFFYVNPLSVHRSTQFLDGRYYVPERQSWFGCACCPPNIARLLASLGNYILAAKGREVAVHLYIQSQARLQIAGEEVLLRQETDYPWDGLVTIFVEPARPVAFALRLRVSGWRRSHSVTLGGEPLDTRVDKGYLVIDRLWQPGDVVQLHLPMPVERMYANPRVHETSCQVALMRGPLVYCLEELDNGGDLDSLVVPASGELSARFDPDILGGVAVIEGAALRAQPQPDDPLYSRSPVTLRPARLSAVPYFAWGNRGVGDMLVWLHAVPT